MLKLNNQLLSFHRLSLSFSEKTAKEKIFNWKMTKNRRSNRLKKKPKDKEESFVEPQEPITYHGLKKKRTTKPSDGKFPFHTIRTVKFLSKTSILTKLQHFHEFFTPIFLTIFLVKSKLSTTKKSKTTTFSRIFHPKKSTIFLVK